VLLALSANSLLRGLAGFLVFLLAFGLRREHAALWWYGLALGASGVGALVGLLFVGRLRERFIEQHILTGAIALVAAAALLAAWWGTLLAQAMLAFFVGVAGSLGQPSFDALTQRLVPLEAQGRAFARFATRQQLIWVAGAVIPVAVAIPLVTGDAIMSVAAAAGVVLYVSSRQALHHRALPGPR
jgi:MFS family permease